jgi:hypothetical protein
VVTRAHEIARRARTELASRLGITPPELDIEVYESADAFRLATGTPWWMAFSVNGSHVELAPPAILEHSRDGLEGSVRRAVAEALVADALAGRPAWVRVGAARYYAGTARIAPPTRRVTCPSDAELALAVSAASYRDAELRAEACFARGIARTRDWRGVR